MTTLIRTLLQAVVLAGGREGEQLRVQSLYQGEGICMALVVLLLSICHPGFGLKVIEKLISLRLRNSYPLRGMLKSSALSILYVNVQTSHGGVSV